MPNSYQRFHKVVWLLVFCFSVNVWAGSIWARKSENAKPLYADDKANQVGDILTIIISEDHKVDNKVKRDLERESERDLSFDSGDLQVGSIHPFPNVSVGTSSSKKLNGKSDYKDERTIEDRVTVIVQDVHPNGNLVITGTREREINGDKQIIQVSGIVRQSDILFDNTVRSEQIANFQLVTISQGVSENYNNPGWLGKVLDAIWPF